MTRGGRGTGAGGWSWGCLLRATQYARRSGHRVKKSPVGGASRLPSRPAKASGTLPLRKHREDIRGGGGQNDSSPPPVARVTLAEPRSRVYRNPQPTKTCARDHPSANCSANPSAKACNETGLTNSPPPISPPPGQRRI